MTTSTSCRSSPAAVPSHAVAAPDTTNGLQQQAPKRSSSSAAAAAAAHQQAVVAPAAFSPRLFRGIIPDVSPPLELLLGSIRAVLHGETSRGFALSANTPGSYERLSAKIEPLLAQAAGMDWHRYAFFNPLHYVRNLVDATNDFELMVLCWAPGQRSRIHNHGSSHCWLTTLQGEVEEAQYSVRQSEASELADETVKSPPADVSDPAVLLCRTPCPGLDLQKVHRVKTGGVAYVNDNLFLHSVGCTEDVPAPGAVTLHLYCPPIKRATLYEPQDNRVVVRTPGFYSVRGVRT